MSVLIKCKPEVKANCPFKVRCCEDELAFYLEGSECDKFAQDAFAAPQTNAAWLRSLDDEGLANVLTDFSNNGGWVTETGRQVCFEQHLEWLRQPHEEVHT